jgi:hypothetical protein
MGGLAREFEHTDEFVGEWLDHAAESGMPVDPRIWIGDPPRSSYPACIAFTAAAEQGAQAAARYLRALRESFMCHRRKLDGPEALMEEARRTGLDTARFRIDLESHATLERFGADLEDVREVPDAARRAGLATRGAHGAPTERLQFPSLRFAEEVWVGGDHSYEDWRRAAIAAGAEPGHGERPEVLDAVTRFGRAATAELEAICDLPGPRAGSEAWRLASEWRLRRVPVLFGELWEPA